MITIPRKALPRRRPNRVRLVEPDGSPVQPDAGTWPAWTDNWYWETGAAPTGLPGTLTAIVPEPDETDEEWIARRECEEAEEKARILAEYQPLPEDVAEYQAWSEGLDAGTLPPAVARRFHFGILDESRYSDSELDAIRSRQVSTAELAQLAAHGAI